MKRNKNEQGSALVWVLVICLIFGVLGIAIGWIALSMNQRSVDSNNLNQTYFTARSAVDAVFNGLNGYQDGDAKNKAFYEELYQNLVYGKKITNTDYAVQYNDFFNNSDSSGMGSCNVEAIMSMGHAKIKATSTVGTSSDTVTLEAYRKPQYVDWPAKEWASSLVADKPEQPVESKKPIYVGNNDSIKKSSAASDNILNGEMDVAVYKLEVGQTLTGVLTVSRDEAIADSKANFEKRAIFIYLEENSTLTLTGMNYAVFKNKVPTTTTTDKWFETKSGYTKMDWNNYYGPDVFIYMENGSKLEFDGPTPSGTEKEVALYPLYIAGTKYDQSDPKISTKKSDVRIYWTQDVIIEKKNNSDKWLKDNEGNSFMDKKTNGVPVRIPLSGYKQAGKPYTNVNIEPETKYTDTAGVFPNRWDVYQYERKSSQ